MLLLSFVGLVVQAAAQVDGTNAVTVMGANLNNATGTIWPIVVGAICALGVVGVFLKFGRKAGFRT